MSTRSAKTLIAAAALVAAACSESPDADRPVTALDLRNGVQRTFGSEGEVPAGWAVCPERGCDEVPPAVPCQNLGPDLCGENPLCRLRELGCSVAGCPAPGPEPVPAEEEGTSGDAVPGGTPGEEPVEPPPTCAEVEPVCDYACVPKDTMLCEELGERLSCEGRSDCEWLEGPCVSQPCAPDGSGCDYSCTGSCAPKAPPTCGELDENSCLVRPDCEWGPDVCPMIDCAVTKDPYDSKAGTDSSPDGEPYCPPCGPFCQPKETACADVVPPPPGSCEAGRWVPSYDDWGCVVSFRCEEACPTVASAPACAGRLEPKYDERGCVVGYTCIEPTADCDALIENYRATLLQARQCALGSTIQACSVRVPDALMCGCETFVTDGPATEKLTLLRQQWDQAGCYYGMACPAIACALPEQGVCADNGLCSDAGTTDGGSSGGSGSAGGL